MRRRTQPRLRSAALVAVATLVLAACGVSAGGRQAPSGPMDAQQVLAATRGSVAFIATPYGTGSAIVIGPGLLVTNAHVVEPFDEVTVTTDDAGQDDLEGEVVGLDLAADVAVVQVDDLDAPALDLADDTALPQGSDLYLVGFPGDQDDHPEATISRGVLSRRRTSSVDDLRFLQTDATIGHGQSGGALVDDRGRVVGMSGLSDDDGFALALAAPDVAEAVDRIRAGEGDDWHPLPDPDHDRRRAALEDGPTAVLFTAADDDTDVRVTVTGGTPALAAVEVGGYPVAANAAALDLAADDPAWSVIVDGADSLEPEPDAPTTWVIHLEAGYDQVLYVEVVGGVAGPAELTADRPFAVVPEAVPVVEDLDHAPPLDVEGTVDSLVPWKIYRVRLEEGVLVDVAARAPTGDAALAVVGPDETYADAAIVDDGGGGLLGLDAETTYTPTETGDHLVVVYAADGYASGFHLQID